MNRKFSSGFTLIELVIVFGIIALISSLSFVSLRGFAERRTVNEASAEFASAAQLAKSRSQTQVKPTDAVCTGRTLDGYRVSLACLGSSCTGYTLTPVCGGSNSTAIKSGTFPTSITVGSSVSSSFLFQTISGIVQGAGNPSIITFSGSAGEKATVRIYKDGRITK
jgi:prepilin-type N-terminal cleavage/methylation domain-containing protein